VADWGNNRIRKVTPAGDVSTLAGGGGYGYADGIGTNAEFKVPSGVAVDSAGNVYVADWGNNRIRKVTPAGVVTTLAGSGSAGFADGNGSNAEFYNPQGLAVDSAGNVYVADSANNRIRKVSALGFRPILTLGVATRTNSTLRLTGTVNPNGFATTARFLYGTNSTNLNLISSVTLTPNNGTNAQAVSNTISTGLTLGKTYFYRLWASNVDGVTTTLADSILMPNTNANLSIGGASLPDKITNDLVSVSSVTGAFDTRHVGIAKPVTITAATLTGTDVGNYTVNLTGQGGTADGNLGSFPRQLRKS
jgi:sugar lactone lactonase YvrE